MKLMVIILNKVEALEPMLARFADLRIGGATILNSTGMARALADYMDDSFLGALRAVLDPDRDENKTILTVLRDEQVPDAVEAIEDTVGSLDEPDTGIVFTLPVDFMRGIRTDDN